MAEKRIAFPIGRAPGYIPSTVIGAAPTFYGQNTLDIQARSAYTSPVKKQYLIKKNQGRGTRKAVNFPPVNFTSYPRRASKTKR